MNYHDHHGDLDEKYVHDLASMAGASYRRTRDGRLSEMKDAFGQYELLMHDKNHSLFRAQDGKLYMSISGTNINPKEKGLGETISDLGTDFILARFGIDMTRAGKRYKSAESFFDKAVGEHGRDNISIVGHSLGGMLARELALKHNLESYSFNPGSSPVSSFQSVRNATLNRDLQERLRKNRTFLVIDDFNTDLLSMSDGVNPYHQTHVYKVKRHKNGKIHSKVKGGVLEGHHINNFKIL